MPETHLLPAIYTVEDYSSTFTCSWDVNMENGTRYNVQASFYPSNKISIGIRNRGFFIFKNIEDLKKEYYVAEKLNLSPADAHYLVKFFDTVLGQEKTYAELVNMQNRKNINFDTDGAGNAGIPYYY